MSPCWSGCVDRRREYARSGSCCIEQGRSRCASTGHDSRRDLAIGALSGEYLNGFTHLEEKVFCFHTGEGRDVGAVGGWSGPGSSVQFKH